MDSQYDWSSLSKLRLGRYAEYFVKMEFTRLGFDVYTAEVDDKGIDFVIRSTGNRYFDVQVKSARRSGLITLPRSKFEPRENLLAAIVLFINGQPPELFLIPSMDWKQQRADILVHYVRRHKEKEKAFDEYQIQLGKRSREELRKRYRFADVAERVASRRWSMWRPGSDEIKRGG